MAATSTFQDLFNGSALDTNKWFINLPPIQGASSANVSVSGGKLNIAETGGNASNVVTIEQFDWANSTVTYTEVSGNFRLIGQGVVIQRNGTNLTFEDPVFGTVFGTVVYNATTMRDLRIAHSGTTYTASYSRNNYDWTVFGTATGKAATGQYPISLTRQGSGTFSIGGINAAPNASPTSEIISPATGDSLTTETPVLTFKAVDFDLDAVSYQVQISLSNTFDTTHTDALSVGGTGFSAGNPYASGANVTYTVQTPLTEGGITYYWRVRARDPQGTNTFGPWAPIQTMVTKPLPPTVTSGAASSITMTSATATGEVTNDGGGFISERGVVYATTASPTTASPKKVSAGTTGTFAVSLTPLEPNTLYHWRSFAINSRATSYGAARTFTTLPAVAIISNITGITHSAASVNVSAPAGGGATIVERGVVHSTQPSPTIEGTKTVVAGSGTTYTANVSGLVGLTQYYVRAYVINAQGVSYSPETTFTTTQTPGAPKVTTGTVGGIAETSVAVTNSEVTLDGTQPVTQRGLVYSSTNDDPTIADLKTNASAGGIGQFTVSLSSIEPETTYYVRAFATNSLGTGYGEVKTFKTLALFIPDAGDGYWTWRPEGSNANIGRSQSTPANASANLMLADLNLEDGELYTLYYSDSSSEGGQTSMVLQWFEGLVKKRQVITAGQPYTFTYNKTHRSWAIRLYVTGASSESDVISAVFNNMYLAKEPSFSSYVPFIRKGLTEIKIDNNWLLDKRREDTIQSVFDAIKGIGWRGFSAKTVGLGWLEIGDKFRVEDDEGIKDVILWETKLTVDGGIKEIIGADDPEESETDYNKASSITKSLRRTQISVDHNAQEINSLVEDVYSENGVVNTKFTEVIQDIESVRTTVQSSGGVNLVRNSVMYAFSDDGVPEYWAMDGEGTLEIQASPESLSAGGISGNIFALSNMQVSQVVTVRKDVDFVLQEDKMYYSFSARVKKNTVGNAFVTITNRNESHIIELPDQEEYYWEAISLENLLPLDDHYEISISSDADANLQVTDVMLSPGENIRQWTQSNGEAMNTNVAITDSGMTIRSNVFRNDYTRINALGFEVHKHEAGGERVFGFNGDETNVRRLRAETQISLAPIRIVPINYGQYKGIAFTRTEDN